LLAGGARRGCALMGRLLARWAMMSALLEYGDAQSNAALVREHFRIIGSAPRRTVRSRRSGCVPWVGPSSARIALRRDHCQATCPI